MASWASIFLWILKQSFELVFNILYTCPSYLLHQQNYKDKDGGGVEVGVEDLEGGESDFSVDAPTQVEKDAENYQHNQVP